MNCLKWLLALCCLGSCQIQQKWGYPFPFLGVAVEGFPITTDLIDRVEEETKLIPAIVVFYLQWPSKVDIKESIRPSLDAIWDNQSVPCITWEPMTIVDQVERAIPYQDILNGEYDNYLDWIASEIKSWGKPLIVRFAHEMNLSRYHWGTSLQDYGFSSTSIYREMFRYVVMFFRNKQVENILWAFCPNAESIPHEDWNVAKNFYPGDQYVDLLGMDGYNWNIDAKLAKAKGQSWTQPWHSFKEIFEALYHQLKEIAPEKPLIVFETASVDRSPNENKLSWLKDALKVAKQWNIQGIVWFQINKEEEWKFNQERNALVDSQQPSFQDWLLKNVNDFR